jgi:hypothetical protein
MFRYATKTISHYAYINPLTFSSGLPPPPGPFRAVNPKITLLCPMTFETSWVFHNVFLSLIRCHSTRCQKLHQIIPEVKLCCHVFRKIQVCSPKGLEIFAMSTKAKCYVKVLISFACLLQRLIQIDDTHGYVLRRPSQSDSVQTDAYCSSSACC